MAVATLFGLLDDIASLMNNVTVVATKATAATTDATSRTIILTGDDAVVTAEQVLKIPAERENAVISKIRNGSFINKGLMILPAMAIGAFAPWVMAPLLMAGGAWLCYEGAEKLFHGKARNTSDGSVEGALRDIKTYQEKEGKKIKGAIRTDRIMSGEIMAVALGSVIKFDPLSQFLALAGVAVATTIAVYEPVRALIRADDVGLRWQESDSEMKRSIGKKLMTIAPKAMHVLSYLGAAATFLVGGGLLVHGIPGGEGLIHTAGQMALSAPGIGGALESVVGLALPTMAGLLAGSVVVAMERSARSLYRMIKPAAGVTGKVQSPSLRQEQPVALKPAYVSAPVAKPVVVKRVTPDINGQFWDASSGQEDVNPGFPQIPPHQIPDGNGLNHSNDHHHL